MFCPLEKIELKTQTCPATNCIYKDAIGQCQYDLLTTDHVSAQEIADVRQLKHYKVKADAALCKEAITKGLICLRYSDFIKDSFPANSAYLESEVVQTVNEVEDKQIRKVLLDVFGLSEYQQDKFLDETRFKAWVVRSKLTLEFSELRTALLAVNENL